MILKFQQGGAIPFVTYTPVVVSGGGQQSSTKGNNNTLSNKDVLELVSKIDGLPSDSDFITQQLANFYYNSQFGETTASLEARYLSIINYLSKAKHYRKEYDEAYDRVVENKGLHEVAINNDGRLVCTNKNGEYNLFTPQELKNNPDYIPLTNAQLLTLRAHDPDLHFTSDLINIASNGIGMEKVTEMIMNITDKMKSSSSKEEGFVVSSSIISGINEFIKAYNENKNKFDPTIQNLYKYSKISKNQADQIVQAANYILKTLPNNAKTLLQVKAANTNTNVADLIMHLIYSQNDITSELNLNLEEGYAKDSSNSDGSFKPSFAYQVQQNMGNRKGTFIIDNAQGVKLSMEGTIFGQVLDPSNNPVGEQSAFDMLSKSQLYDLNIGKFYFGNQEIKGGSLKDIIYDDIQGLMRVNVPVNNAGKPNLELLKLYDELRKDVILDEGTVEQLLNTSKYKSLKNMLDENGEWKLEYVKPFIVFNGKISEDLLEIEKTNTFVRPIELDDAQLKKYNTILSIEKDSSNKPKSRGLSEDWYAGVVFMPIHMAKNASISGVGINTRNRLEQEYIDSRKPKYTSYNINVLNQ